MQEGIMSDMGWMLAIAGAFVLLIIVVWGYFSAAGFRKITRKGTTSRFETVITEQFGKSPMFLFAIVAIIFVVTTLAMFSFYYQVAGGQPYISSEMGNLLFVSAIVILIVSMFTLAMALMKNIGALGMWKRLTEKQRGSA